MEKSIKNLIKTAFTAVGKVMYIYGGGWNEDDSGGGKETTDLGLSQKWLDFSKSCDKEYNYKDYDFIKSKECIHLGLDCSAYVGWVMFNLFEKGSDYVVKSGDFGYHFEKMGYGYVVNDNEFRAGDIMFKDGHIFISLGKCSDKSVVLLHSSPPGVQLGGTFSPEGNKNSMAVALAEKYMKTYFKDWFEKFPNISRDTSYLTDYRCFRWSILEDKEKYTQISIEEILIDIFSDYA